MSNEAHEVRRERPSFLLATPATSSAATKRSSGPPCRLLLVPATVYMAGYCPGVQFDPVTPPWATGTGGQSDVTQEPAEGRAGSRRQHFVI